MGNKRSSRVRQRAVPFHQPSAPQPPRPGDAEADRAGGPDAADAAPAALHVNVPVRLLHRRCGGVRGALTCRGPEPAGAAAVRLHHAVARGGAAVGVQLGVHVALQG